MIRAPFSTNLALCFCITIGLSSCRDSDGPTNAPKRLSGDKAGKIRLPLDKPLPGIDRAIKEFTGGHAALVWVESQVEDSPDTFADGVELLLKGINTSDNKGERIIVPQLGNYSRPLISSDGKAILYTRKEVVRVKSRKGFDCQVFRTGWNGEPPALLAEGLAVDTWRDPATGIEWVYAARDFPASKKTSTNGARLVRFMLNDPKVEELVYDEGMVSVDNIQMSRDGTRASGQFPWPKCGVFLAETDGRLHPWKLQTGCWPSLAPDNSGVAWVFDGSHRAATFFTHDKAKSWKVKFDTAPGLKGYEAYHPRWSNHPLFFTMTGPYISGKRPQGNMIRKGGASAQVYIGRFSKTLDKVVDWIQVSHDSLGESFPDLWVSEADTVDLETFARRPEIEADIRPAMGWPEIKDALLFLWHDRDSVNHFKTRTGKIVDSSNLESRNAARFGRQEEMRVDGGYFETEPDQENVPENAPEGSREATLEMVLLQDALSGTPDALPFRVIFQGMDRCIGLDANNRLVIAQNESQVTTSGPVPTGNLHLIAACRADGVEVFVNGTAVPTTPLATPPPFVSRRGLTFGGGWEGGILSVALHSRALTAAEANRQWISREPLFASLSPSPPRVRLTGKLVQASAMPLVESIAPYTSAMSVYVYAVERVLVGSLTESRILVKHWTMLDQKVVTGFPREVGKSYELLIERESDHPHLTGERVVDDTEEFEKEAWFDVASPQVK